ncbi:hypothetical protein BDZ97DRAFT_1873316 [Flammula alnicola]|nr:hypothetical protein BDZ97DRAFT_1873316 [Flammula alnicola]
MTHCTLRERNTMDSQISLDDRPLSVGQVESLTIYPGELGRAFKFTRPALDRCRISMLPNVDIDSHGSCSHFLALTDFAKPASSTIEHLVYAFKASSHAIAQVVLAIILWAFGVSSEKLLQQLTIDILDRSLIADIFLKRRGIAWMTSLDSNVPALHTVILYFSDDDDVCPLPNMNAKGLGESQFGPRPALKF